ncbi:MAG: TIGR00725 family protein [Candidatus Lokiarchaeota archaeon]|nr:TIGR00725 family protein [Candidatus Harpocratesius repetitus]
MEISKNFKPIVSVCGSKTISKEIYKISEELGSLLAENGYIVACGGLTGVMEAAAKGAFLKNGIVVGILPTATKESANPYISIPIPTGMGESRNVILVSMADVVVTISGASGTLSEIALAWKMGKKIISLSNTGGWSAKLAGTSIDNTRNDKILNAHSSQEVIKLIKSIYQ